jgi:hypothetical protein
MLINVKTASFTRHIMTVLAVTTVMFISSMPMLPEASAAESQGDAVTLLSPETLEELVGPIALYPDELVAVTLPASTFPLQIVQAARFLEKHKKDSKLKPDEAWDSSVLGLVNYPEVITKMNADLDWTERLGDAVVNQQDDVMDAIQSFRKKAKDAGNLKTDEKIVIVEETEVIVIKSATPEVIYVPSYNPTTVVVYSTSPYRYVYSTPYPYYYSPAATFWTGMFVGAAISYGVGWRGYGRGGNNDININRSTNISGNTINRGSGNSWKSDRSRGSRGGRPSTNRGGAGARPGTGKRTSFGNGSRAGSRPGSKPSTGKRPSAGTKPSTGKRPSAGTKPSTSKRSSTGRSGSFGNYSSGKRSSTHSQRGKQSRSSRSSSRSSRSSGRASRGGGGRGGGRGRR